MQRRTAGAMEGWRLKRSGVVVMQRESEEG